MKIIDSDRDAAASVDRLTVLVERLKAQNAELQVMLTASEDRVRVLETALREIQRRTDGVTDVGWYGVNELRTLIAVAFERAYCKGPALTPAPPAATPAPTYHSNWHSCGPAASDLPMPVARDASVDAPGMGLVETMREAYGDPMTKEIDRLRAELVAEKKRADEAEQYRNGMLAAVRKADEALAGTTAKLGRAVAALQATANRLGCRVGLRDDCKVANGRQCYGCETLDVFDAILADADGTQAAAAYQALVAKAALLDAPEIHDFVRAVTIEAAHQRARWASEHDAGKTDADWFWLIGFLAGKALHNPGGEHDKQLHRIITVAAAACNWHAAKLGKTNMRPGIDGEAALAAVDARRGGGR